MEEGNVLEQPVSRRELLKKVAVYSPPILLAGSALAGAGVAFAGTAESSTAGSTSVCAEGTGTTSHASGSSSASGSGGSPLGALSNDLALLLTITATGQPTEDKKIAQAVGFLTEATNSPAWVDDETLSASGGDSVFYYLKWAADALSTSVNSNAPSLVSDVVAQAGTLANIALTSKCESAKIAKKAQNKLSTGSTRAANGNPRGAIAAYMHAWDLVVTGTLSPDTDDPDS